MRTFYLIACAARKADTPQPAAKLYRSPLFAKALAYARRRAPDNDIFILSALHGVLPLDEVVAPYDVTLGAYSCTGLRTWAAKVARQLIRRARMQPSHFVFLAGSRYRKGPAAWLEQWGHTTEAPLAGLGIGKQLAFLTADDPLGNATVSGGSGAPGAGDYPPKGGDHGQG